MTKYIEQRPDLEPLMRDNWEVIARIENRQHTWMGVPTQKHPMDFWVYQEMLYEMKPDVILEIGNYTGGSTYAFAHLCDIMNHGRIISVDITDENHDPCEDMHNHERITWIVGDATQPEVVKTIKDMIKPEERVLVIEDSAHTLETTYAVLELYQDLTRVGDYLIVEDTVCYHGLNVGYMPGAYEAVELFLAKHPNWEADRTKEKFIMTWNPKGFLKRKY